MRGSGFHRYLRVPIEFVSANTETVQLIAKDVFWIRALRASENTCDSQFTAKDNLFSRSTNRERPLIWIRNLADQNFNAQVNWNSEAIREVDAYLNHGPLPSTKYLEVITTILRRPRAIWVNLRLLRKFSDRQIAHLTRPVRMCYNRYHQDPISGILKVFWSKQKLPSVPIRPPKCIHGRARYKLERVVLIPWMRKNKLYTVKWQNLWKQCPNFEELAVNHVHFAKLRPGERFCQCDRSQLGKVQGHVLDTSDSLFNHVQLPDTWSSRCRPPPSTSWTAGVWDTQLARVQNAYGRYMKSLSDTLQAKLPYLKQVYSFGKTEGKVPDLAPLKRAVRLTRGFVVGCVDKSKGRCFVACPVRWGEFLDAFVVASNNCEEISTALEEHEPFGGFWSLPAQLRRPLSIPLGPSSSHQRGFLTIIIKWKSLKRLGESNLSWAAIKIRPLVSYHRHWYRPWLRFTCRALNKMISTVYADGACVSSNREIVRAFHEWNRAQSQRGTDGGE